MLRFCGKGFFDYSNSWRCVYYRLLGATIGVNVKLSSKCAITEYSILWRP